MQDIHSIGGGRIFSGGGGDRRLRPHHHHQALKCPRCDSLNTKFCYYNNYNLSQPRHFCKNCRRYWTKGGVLRNVPVGGGCRKAKRSKTKPSPETTPAAAVTTAVAPPQQQQQQQHDQHKSNSHSSSESSSLTAANSNIAVTNNSINNNNNSSACGTAEAMSAVTSQSNFIEVSESKFYGNPNSGFEPGLLEQGSACGLFSEIGNFTSLINSSTSNNETLSSFGFGKGLNGQLLEQGQWQHQQEQHRKVMNMEGNTEIGRGLLDQTVPFDSSKWHTTSEGEGVGGFGPLDWQGSGDQGLFDLPNAVDHTYWSQSQWTDQDHPTLYLP